jgi:hypothetical protein
MAHPAEHLYSHALKSLLAFSSLGNLAALMAVSRRWQKAVLIMRPLALSTDIMEANLLLRSGCMSRLCRYVTALTAVASSPVALHEMLASIASQLPRLRNLRAYRRT